MGRGKAICQQILQGGFQESGEFQISGHYESSVRRLSCLVEHRRCDTPRNCTLSLSYALIQTWVDNS